MGCYAARSRACGPLRLCLPGLPAYKPCFARLAGSAGSPGSADRPHSPAIASLSGSLRRDLAIRPMSASELHSWSSALRDRQPPPPDSPSSSPLIVPARTSGPKGHSGSSSLGPDWALGPEGGRPFRRIGDLGEAPWASSRLPPYGGPHLRWGVSAWGPGRRPTGYSGRWVGFAHAHLQRSWRWANTYDDVYSGLSLEREALVGTRTSSFGACARTSP